MKLTFKLYPNRYLKTEPYVELYRDGTFVGYVYEFDGEPTIYLFCEGTKIQCITLKETEEILDQWDKCKEMVKKYKRKEIMNDFMKKGVALGQWGWIDRHDGNKTYCLMCGAPPMEPRWENCQDIGRKLSDCDKECTACHGSKSVGFALGLT